jgi:hypothetical protein
MFWKKKTRDQQIEKRVESVFSELTSDIEFEFTELEIVQILNDVRRKLDNSLKNKKSDCLSKSTELVQKSTEIQSAIDLLK